MIILWIDHRALQWDSLLRSFIVDAFILFYFYTDNKAERRVFRDFYENREELVKFKELLADSLPQSVTVITKDNQQLFANKSFNTTFDSKNEQTEPERQFRTDTTLLQPEYTSFWDYIASSLQVGQSEVRKIDTLQENINLSFTGPQERSKSLNDIIKNLNKHNLISDKALSTTASFDSGKEHKSFEIIMKGVRWDRNDAIAIIFNDITHHENIIALRLANKKKDTVIATVSHELRTPLNGILGLLEIAEGKIAQPEVLEYLSLCKDNANLLLSLVNSHLDLQQLSAGKLKLNPSRASLKKILADVTKLFQFQTKHKNIYLNFNISEGISAYIITDVNRLKQILINLIGNALKFTSQGGITIDVFQDPKNEDCLRFAVVDTGIGIKEEDKGKLFKMYGKLEDGVGMNRNGVGLGLIISNVLALLLSGDNGEMGITVTSQYGVGTSFSFKILKNLELFESRSNPKGCEQAGGQKSDTIPQKKESSLEQVGSQERMIYSENKVSYDFDGDLQEFSTPANLNSKISSYKSLKIFNFNEINHGARQARIVDRVRTRDSKLVNSLNPESNKLVIF